MLTKADIIEKLKELGLKEGDICLFHSSYKSLGEVEGGAETVISAFESVIGKEGTLVVPTLSIVDFHNSYKTWHLDKPSDVGYLTEYFRKQMYVYRSNQETHSVAARGKLAYELTYEHGWGEPRLCPFGEYPFSETSPWQKMENLNAKVVFIGVTMRYNTMKHLIETKVMHHFLSLIKDEKKRELQKEKMRKFGQTEGPWPFYHGENMQARIEELGLLKHVKCGDAELIMYKAKETNAATRDILINDYKNWCNEGTVQWIEECLKG